MVARRCRTFAALSSDAEIRDLLHRWRTWALRCRSPFPSHIANSLTLNIEKPSLVLLQLVPASLVSPFVLGNPGRFISFSWLEVRYTATIVEVYHNGRRVASHRRRYDHRPSTLSEHMPRAHRAHAEWTPSRLIRWGEQTGPKTGLLVEEIMKRWPHPEQGYRACLGLMSLGRRSGADRLEAACRHALHLQSYSYRTVRNILSSAQDRLPFDDTETPPTPHRSLDFGRSKLRS